MFEKFDSMKERHRELQQLLSDPKVISDRTVYQRYAKELSNLNPICARYEEYQKLCKQIQQTEELSRSEKEKAIVDLAREELEKLKAQERQLRRQLEEMLIEQEPQAQRNVIVEIRAGTGGLEASLFAADLFRMYNKYAAGQGWKLDVMNTSPTGAGGFKEIIFAIEGQDVYKKLRYESGVHRVQRVPVTEASGRIHTSAVSVAVLPQAEEVDVKIDPKDLKIDVFRSTGPGGQGVNTTDSAVRITHLPTNTVVTCQDERSQLKNKLKAMKVLRARLLDKVRTQKEERISRQRRILIGTGDRSEKIRTYNFPQGRVTDHRIGLTLHKLEDILNGRLDEMISHLLAADRKMRTA